MQRLLLTGQGGFQTIKKGEKLGFSPFSAKRKAIFI
jgi:hypothetical protein